MQPNDSALAANAARSRPARALASPSRLSSPSSPSLRASASRGVGAFGTPTSRTSLPNNSSSSRDTRAMASRMGLNTRTGRRRRMMPLGVRMRRRGMGAVMYRYVLIAASCYSSSSLNSSLISQSLLVRRPPPASIRHHLNTAARQARARTRRLKVHRPHTFEVGGSASGRCL